MGVDLGIDGVTANDADDVDTGPNNLQNFLTSVTARRQGADLLLDVALESTPGTNFRVEVFATQDCNLLPRWAEAFRGAVNVRTDANGDATTSFVLPAVSTGAGNGVLTTVSELVGQIPRSTSEFSGCVPVTS